MKSNRLEYIEGINYSTHNTKQQNISSVPLSNRAEQICLTFSIRSRDGNGA